MADAIPDALALLASGFERDGCPIQAIHCLQALANRQLPSDFEAKARLHLGRLLLEHTYNFKEALCHLLRAAYTAISDLLPKSNRSSSDWPVVCAWMCRLAQRAAAVHARCGRGEEAVLAAREGLAVAEANVLQEQKVIFLLILLQLALGRWDHAAVDSALNSLRTALTDTATAAAAAVGRGTGATGSGGGGGLDPYWHPHVLLHVSLLQVLYLLRLGKVTEVVKAEPQGAPKQQQQSAPATAAAAVAPPDPDGPDMPPPPVLERLEALLQQIKQQQQQQGQGQWQQGQDENLHSVLDGREPAAKGFFRPVPLTEALTDCRTSCLAFPAWSRWCVWCAPLPYVPAAHGRAWWRHTCNELLLAAGIDPLTPSGGGEGGGMDVEEAGLPHQIVDHARTGLQLHALVLQCKIQVELAKAELRAARDDLLCCQQLHERFPSLLRGLLPGAHLVTGQYCVATGELPVAVAHFEFARRNAPSRPAAALAAVLEAEVHLSVRPNTHPQAQQHQAAGAGGDVGSALAALGPFYAAAQEGTTNPTSVSASGKLAGSAMAAAAAAVAGGGGGVGGGPDVGGLGNLEEAACMLASASCLEQQGELAAANQLLSRALKLAFKRLGHTQLTCAILNQLAPIIMSQQPGQPDTHSASEAAKSAVTLSQQAGDLWAEAQGKQLLAAIARVRGEPDRAAAEAASAARRLHRIAAAAAEALSDSGRHGYAAGWGLTAVSE
ncbi:hypothetical protein VOLCADRAFT_98912 [Volvox carteri f. nagariensis]|uniref:Uncharacterized protein n=1 Tax=Volvox carteri f. nagariensis TaxID=3068 RepID=D8UGL0_VOLCA|nr:uncharacterized protein VOLCADRAFT_98912 [Volvox carteri f. nagariensis]EFJ41116.1 hypothetical protein VOLCADRAFT_98912 [Volvox carteri f. nagariensis]|eukprot:XP_002957788.1 hypothetical protein VOLCADRAFT_98912 [Volvox carteri f. nagariensis]